MTVNADVVVALACDHAALALRDAMKARLEARGFATLDLGPQSTVSVDYPDYAAALAAAIADGRAERGVLCCGTGLGMSIAVNRNAAVRGALCHDVTTARLARAHNDANVLVLGARVVGEQVAADALDAFLDTAFEGGRHARRVAKMSG
ncbi:MAG: ribose 5-phosphate isomerase B [Pseudomonadota bacterium]